jgi:drug/metabolite transporter (DMT)-like permease
MSLRSWVYFGVLCIAWGIPYYLIKVALLDVSPSGIAFGRVAFGSLVLCAIVPPSPLAPHRAASAGAGLRRARRSRPSLLFDFNGRTLVSSSLTGLLLAAMPFVVALLSIAVDRSEHVTGWQVGGLAIGIGGVAVLLGFGGRDRESLLGAALVAAATVLYSVGALAVKRWLADVPLRASTAATLVIAAVALALERLQRLPCIFPALPRSSQLPDSA